jgi:hypothetical protein
MHVEDVHKDADAQARFGGKGVRHAGYFNDLAVRGADRYAKGRRDLTFGVPEKIQAKHDRREKHGGRPRATERGRDERREGTKKNGRRAFRGYAG